MTDPAAALSERIAFEFLRNPYCRVDKADDLVKEVQILEAERAQQTAQVKALEKGINDLADHIEETLTQPWEPPFYHVEDCDSTWKSYVEHEVAELRVLAAGKESKA